MNEICTFPLAFRFVLISCKERNGPYMAMTLTDVLQAYVDYQPPFLFCIKSSQQPPGSCSPIGTAIGISYLGLSLGTALNSHISFPLLSLGQIGGISHQIVPVSAEFRLGLEQGLWEFAHSLFFSLPFSFFLFY